MFARVIKSTVFRGQNLNFLRYNSTEAYDAVIKSIRNDLKASIRMKADPIEKNVIRSILSEVKNYEVENFSKTQDEFALYELLNKMIKQRKETADVYLKEDSNSVKMQEAAFNELREVPYITKYVETLNVAKPEEVEAKVKEIAEKLHAQGDLNSIKDLMSNIPWKFIQDDWKAPRSLVSATVNKVFSDLKA